MHPEQYAVKKSRSASFTLVELLVVIAVIIILAGITIPVSHYAGKRAQQAKESVEREKIKLALDEYRAVYGEYPIVGSSNHYPVNWEPDPDTSSNLPPRFRMVNLVDSSGDTNSVHMCPGAIENLPFGSKWGEAAGVSVNHRLSYPLFVRPREEGRPPFLECEKVTVCFLVWRNVDVDGYIGTNRYYIGEDKMNFVERTFLRGDPVNRFVAVNPATGAQWKYSCTDGTTYTLD